MLVAEATRDAQEALVRQGLPLVRRIVRGTLARLPSHVSADELTSAGLAGLVEAARSYDARRGAAFTAYASARIRGAVIDELRTMDWASRSVRRRDREVDAVRDELAGALGRTPSEPEIARALGLTGEELAAHRDDVARAGVMSLQGIDEAAVEELLPAGGPSPEAVVVRRERIAYLHDAVATLPERLRAVVEGYFFRERPMAQIAVELGVTESRVSQLRAEAVGLLRDAISTALDQDLVPEQATAQGCAARRRQAYVARVASRRSYLARLSPAAYPARIA